MEDSALYTRSPWPNPHIKFMSRQTTFCPVAAPLLPRPAAAACPPRPHQNRDHRWHHRLGCYHLLRLRCHSDESSSCSHLETLATFWQGLHGNMPTATLSRTCTATGKATQVAPSPTAATQQTPPQGRQSKQRLQPTHNHAGSRKARCGVKGVALNGQRPKEACVQVRTKYEHRQHRQHRQNTHENEARQHKNAGQEEAGQHREVYIYINTYSRRYKYIYKVLLLEKTILTIM